MDPLLDGLTKRRDPLAVSVSGVAAGPRRLAHTIPPQRPPSRQPFHHGARDVRRVTWPASFRFQGRRRHPLRAGPLHPADHVAANDRRERG